MNKQFFAGLWLVLLSLLATPAISAVVPEEVVRQTSDQMLAELMTRKQELQASPGKIYDLVEHIVLPRFDFQRMSQLVLGKYWRRAKEAEKEAFVKAFRQLLVRTYATALLNYSGEEIVYLPSREDGGGSEATVNTAVQATGALPIPIDYRLYLNGEEWKVFDVSIDGISLVSNYRTSFASQIRRYKLSGLIEKLEQRNEQRN
ncbi:MlaC/ttg2D family ABC transporter substrate-binding protein [Sedimenticola sp.]|uniref:MlaC/ttg2D family ABC transporter substrate-binding protein n=1 Tax=Sedimenticola sp. TaxID=1940285 RepID=UPI003D09FDC6